MHICYLSEGTPLCGGVKVTFEQAEALQARGHQVEIVSKGLPPDWYDLRVPFRQVDEFSPSNLPECDFIIGTFWPTVKAAMASGKGCPVHLCQGYEGDTPAYAADQQEIEDVYRLPTLTLTVHEPLTRLIWQRFGKRAHTIGQGINHAVFFPGVRWNSPPPYRVLLVGLYEDECKGIVEGLTALQELKKTLPLQVVRASALPCSEEERAFAVVDEYHYRLRAEDMGALYRSCDVLLGPARAREGFGLPALEALACGVPSAVSSIPAFRAFAEFSDWAMFFPEGDVPAMQIAVKQLLEDEEHRAQLRARGRVVAQRYTFAQVAERIERVFAAVAA